MLWKLTQPPSNNWPGKILEGISLQIETDSNCTESKQCFNQISEYCLRKEFRYSMFVYTPLPYPRKQWSIFNTRYAPSSSLGVYPGLSLKGRRPSFFLCKIWAWKTKLVTLPCFRKHSRSKIKVIKISCHSPSPARETLQYPCTSTQLQMGKM